LSPKLFAVCFSLVLHATVLVLGGNHLLRFANKLDLKEVTETVTMVEPMPPPPPKVLALANNQPQHAAASRVPVPPRVPATPPPSQAADASQAAAPSTLHQTASLAAPAAPTPQEWAFAAKYTLKNSKGYRYNWGQQVRSMMGTAVEGPDQGVVRFRVEIAPDGTLAKLETLWSTSAVAEQLARKAIIQMPALPPTPTGRPLVFEKTISFSPFAAVSPPTYKDDCLPDPPTFRNPFVWDGKSPQVRAAQKPVEKPDAQALAECLKQLPQDSVEAESAQDQRLLDQWGSKKSGR
jgi:hypothetical protein